MSEGFWFRSAIRQLQSPKEKKKKKTTYKKIHTARVFYVENQRNPSGPLVEVGLITIETKLILIHQLVALLLLGNLCLVQTYLAELLQFQKPLCSV